MRQFLDGPREGDLPGPVALPSHVPGAGGAYSPRRRRCEGERCRCSSRWASRPTSRSSTARSSGRPNATVGGAGGGTRAAAPEVERALATLVDVGLALRPDDQSYAGAPPAVALGALITEQRQGLRLAEQALATLAEQHRSAVVGQTISDLIEVVTGVDAIRHRFQQVQQAADHEMRTFITAPFVAVRPGENAAEPAAVERGVRIRAVVERAALSEPGAIEEAMESLRRGLELRVVDQLPIKLVLADADLALVPLEVASGGEPGAVLIQRSGLLAALEALFEAVWRQAHPLELSEPRERRAADPGAASRTDRPRWTGGSWP